MKWPKVEEMALDLLKRVDKKIEEELGQEDKVRERRVKNLIGRTKSQRWRRR